MTPVDRKYANYNAWHRGADALNDMSDARITSSTVAILAVITRRVNKTTGVAFAAFEAISDEAQCSESTAKRTVNLLVELGLLDRTSGGRPNRANRYRLGPNVPEFVEKEKSTYDSGKSTTQSNGGRKPDAGAATPGLGRMSSLMKWE